MVAPDLQKTTEERKLKSLFRHITKKVRLIYKDEEVDVGDRVISKHLTSNDVWEIEEVDEFRNRYKLKPVSGAALKGRGKLWQTCDMKFVDENTAYSDWFYLLNEKST